MGKKQKAEGLGGLTKAAVLLVSLDSDTSSKILANLQTEDIERISMEIARLEDIGPETRDAVVREYYQIHQARKYLEQGGLDFARQLLEKSLPPEDAAAILEGLQQSIAQTPFHFLKKTDPENLMTFIQEEHPQTIALILAHLSSKQASEVLQGLSAKKQIEVVKRVARMEQTTPEAIRQVEAGLETRLASVMSQELEQAGGIETIAEILNLVDRTTEKGILENLEEEDPDMVEQIRRLMFVFEDVLLVNDKGIQAVLKEIEGEDLALALKTASEELQNKVFKNMSERAATLIKEDMEYMGPVRVSDVEGAQQRIVDVVRRLEEAGEVIISGRGGEEEIVV
jgi:flagellar motor switch protein FliG